MEPIENGASAEPTPAPTTNTSTSPQPAPVATPDNQLIMGILAYVGILVLIPLLTSKNDPVVKFHIKQGIVLVVIELGMWVVGMMVPLLFPIIGIVNLGSLILSIIGIVNVVQKKQAELPLVGKFAAHVNI